MSEVAEAGPERVIDAYVEKTVSMLDFVRPALHAAIELGRPELRRALAAGLKDDADALVSVLSALRPGRPIAEGAAESIRRTILGLAVDEGVDADDARGQLDWLLRELLPPHGLDPLGDDRQEPPCAT